MTDETPQHRPDAAPDALRPEVSAPDAATASGVAPSKDGPGSGPTDRFAGDQPAGGRCAAEQADPAAAASAVQEVDGAPADPSGDTGTTSAAGELQTGAAPDADRCGRHWGRRRGKKAKSPRRKAPWWELPALVILAIIVAVLVKSFVIQPFYIPSGSMEKTLAGGDGFGHDRILVNKTIYDFRDPHPGDIAVFHAPAGWSDGPPTTPPSNLILKGIRGFGQLVGFVPPDGEILVKRVIATGGQTVRGLRVDAAGKVCTDPAGAGCRDVVQISTHGPQGPWRSLDEPYVYGGASDTIAGTFGPVTVPKGRLWVMGDHRSDSEDSRYHCAHNSSGPLSPGQTCDPTYSTVPVGKVIGKAIVVAWPPSHWRTLGTPPTFEKAGAAAASTAPTLLATLFTLPILLIRRRRRRRPRRA